MPRTPMESESGGLEASEDHRPVLTRVGIGKPVSTRTWPWTNVRFWPQAATPKNSALAVR